MPVIHGTPMRHAFVVLAAIAVSFAVFAIWPRLDLWVAALFYDVASGFSRADDGLPNLIRLAIWRMSEALLCVSIGALIFGVFRRGNVLGHSRKAWGFILALYLLGPGLLVDTILKPIWGRARPANVAEFGGQLQFTPPYQIAGECTRNCSFVSGEVSGAVALAISLLMILAQVRGRMTKLSHDITVLVILALPLYTAFQRIAAGRHFLSDAVFAALFTALVALLLAAARDISGRLKAWLQRR